MGPSSLKISFGLCLLLAQLTIFHATDPSENLTETDDAEFRQGGISQQLMASYPGISGMYGGNTGGFQYMANTAGGAGGAGTGYVNMLRNLYRPPNFGLTDKVKHWVKSFMNRRQYVKPYYSPSMSGLQYSADEFSGKPVFVGGNSYKAISVPLRQLQKYYKPYYASGESAAASQFLQSPPRSPSANAGNSILSYSPNGGGASSGGLYTSETANSGHFAGGNSGFFGAAADGSNALFGSSGSAGGANLFSGNPSGSNIYSGNPSSSLFTSGGASGSNIFTSGGGSSNIFSQGEGGSSALFSAAGLPGGSLYGSGGSPSSGLYHGSNGGSGSSVYSLDGSSGGLYGSDGGSSYFASSNGGSNYGSNSGSPNYGSSAAASSLLSSLNSASNAGAYGDLYASGASPQAAIQNPNSGDQARGYSGSNSKNPSYGASSSALYMSSDQRNADAYSAQDSVNSFTVDSSRGSQAQQPSSYSVSFQPAQGKSYSSDSNSGFQPVSFSSEDGYKSNSFSGKSS